ncbi:MAG: ROK family protein [Planctomycetota bacterium]
MAKSKESNRLYLGVDIGGTKLQASLVTEAGAMICRERTATPRTGGPERVVAALEKLIEDTLAKAKTERERLTAIGLAVPGVVDPSQGRVVVTPNMSLTGVAISILLEARFKVPVAMGNDGNLGALGERWLGSARNAKSAVAILVGTGIGGGLVRKGKLWRGARESAGEIGHIVMQIDGPLCGCGNRGCFEALASRTAIERDIRQAIAEGRQSVLTTLCDGDLSVIRSGAIRKALEAEDSLVTEVMHRASEIIAYGCLTVRHLVDPEVIVLGGGLVMACSDFMLPIIENIVGSDNLPGAREGGRVLLSALGDDAVVLGAVALARTLVGRDPFKSRFTVQTEYPQIAHAGYGEITVGRKSYSRDIYISVYGEVKKRKKSLTRELHGSAHEVRPEELAKVCEGGPEVLFIGAGNEGKIELSKEAQRFLAQRSIRLEVLPTQQAAEAYNRSAQRKALLMHVSC